MVQEKTYTTLEPFHSTEYFQLKQFQTCKQNINVVQACIYLLKAINGNIRTIKEIGSKLTIKTPERRH